MLVSRQHLIAFAHYPKTAGTSLQRWFTDSFPDASLLVPKNPHLNVADSLKKLQRWKEVRHIVRLIHRSTPFVSPRACDLPWPMSLRVVGVMREPFEMLVSLYEYWRRDVFTIEPTQPFILLARHGEFRDFLAAALIGKRMPTYEEFFNVGGPLWPHTLLLDFESLQAGIDSFCHRIGVPNSKPLPAINQNPNGVRDIQRYRDEAGPLLAEVHQRFRWYYEEGIHLTIRTSQPLKVAA